MILGKDSAEIKEHLKSIEAKIENISDKIAKSSSEFVEFKESIRIEVGRIKEQQKENFGEFQDTLRKITALSNEFERSLDSFNNIKNRIDDTLLRKITEVTDVEISAIRKKMQEFNNIEKEFKALVSDVSNLKSKIQEFNNISANIKEVDFTLHKHARDLESADRRKLELEKENENLKSIMAKMQRANRKF